MIGCGFVGSASVFALMQSGLFTEIVLIDADKNKAEGEAMDISHGIPFASPMKIYAGDYDDVADAAIVVISAGAGQKPGETRLDLVNKNVILKSGTSDSRKDWFAVGDYKKIPNEVGGMDTALPEEVADKMKTLLTEYNGKEEKNFEDILDFHVKFERIHPFQDGNGRVGRLIMFKECLKYNIVPFIIEDNLKMFYYRGLKEWNNEKGYLTDTCLTAQDK